jgi:hypothetical protein
MGNSQGLVQRRSRQVYSVASRYFQLFRNPQFGLTPVDDKQADWNAFQHVVTGFLGNIKAVNFCKFVEDIITYY